MLRPWLTLHNCSQVVVYLTLNIEMDFVRVHRTYLIPKNKIGCLRKWLQGSKKYKWWNLSRHLCLVLLQVPKCFGLVQIFCARPKIYLHIVAITNILCQTKRWFVFSKIRFCAGTKVIEEALNAVKFLGWHKIFGPAQNILRPVKGQGIR